MIRVGQKLREERIARGLSLEEVAKATKIKQSFLQAIERGEYQKLPSSAYAQGFVRNYAEYLGLPKRETLAVFRREFDEEKIYKVLPEGFSHNENFPVRRFRIQQTLIIVLVLFLLFGGYLLFQYRYAFINPPLSIESPEEGAKTSSDLVVTGTTDPNVVVSVNEEVVEVDSNGQFTKRLTLFEGDATIHVRAKHRLGKETVIERKVNVQ